LKPNGAVLIKTSHGTGFERLLESVRRPFTKVRFPRFDTSRARSSELYLLASGFRMV
jgi:23S rRNA methylase